MRIIVSGGGTGGHIYPALTLIRALQRKVNNAEFLYVGTSEGLEADIVPKENIPFETVNIEGFKRSLSPANLMRGMKAAAGVMKAMGIVRRFHPDVAIGTGGYVCGPILLAASLMHVPTLIQEQNVTPGITNKILSKFVTKIAIGTKEAFGLDPRKKTLLVSGGSRGARTINRAMIGVLEHYAGDPSVQIIHVTGSAGYDDTMKRIRESNIDVEGAGNLFVKKYLYDMPTALAAADLAVFRAGAIGIAELMARGVPSVLVPYPYAAANHQEHNARAIEAAGAARVILDKDLRAESLLATLAELLTESDKLKKMARSAKRLGRPKAADEIADIVLKIANK